MSEDVVGSVARGIYYVFREPMKGAPWFDQLPEDARAFLRKQARAGIEKIQQPTDGMVASAAAETGLDVEVIETVWNVMIGHILNPHANGQAVS